MDMMSKDKILMVITKGNWGGAQKYVYEIATHLPKDQFDVTVAHGEGDTLPFKLCNAGIKTQNIPNLGRDINIVKEFTVFFTLLKLFRKEKPDVVHLNSSKIGGLGALAARFSGIQKIVFTVHGFAFNEDRSWIQRKIIAFMSWLTLILCTDVICISELERNRASTWPFTSKKLHLIYNGIETPTFLEKHAARIALSKAINQPETIFENKIVIGTIGELTKNKGYTYALEGIKDIPNSLYIIIGQGEEKEMVETWIKKNGCSDKIFLAGFIKDAATLIKACDIFLLPSIKEGVPYVLLEAGLAEVPVICTNVGGIPEIITDNVTGFLIEPKNSTAVKKTIETMSADESLRKSSIPRFKAKIEKNFSVDKMLEKTIKAYSTLV